MVVFFGYFLYVFCYSSCKCTDLIFFDNLHKLFCVFCLKFVLLHFLYCYLLAFVPRKSTYVLLFVYDYVHIFMWCENLKGIRNGMLVCNLEPKWKLSLKEVSQFELKSSKSSNLWSGVHKLTTEMFTSTFNFCILSLKSFMITFLFYGHVFSNIWTNLGTILLFNNYYKFSYLIQF